MKKYILVSGANGNLGFYYTKRKLLESDFHFILLYHKTSEKIIELKKNFSDRILLLQADIKKYENIKKVLQPVLQEVFLFSFLHTASKRSSDFMKLEKTEPSHWEEVINTNILGTYNILKLVLKKFRDQKFGKIVLMGSNVSRIGLPNGSAYAASKAAISNLTRTLAFEESYNNILINTVSPGPIKIDDSHFSEEYRKFRREYYDKMLTQTPVKRLATLSDVYNAIDFLLSEKNTYITGEEIFVTGGKL